MKVLTCHVNPPWRWHTVFRGAARAAWRAYERQRIYSRGLYCIIETDRGELRASKWPAWANEPTAAHFHQRAPASVRRNPASGHRTSGAK